MARNKKKTVISGIRLEKYAAEGKSVAHLEDGKTLFVTGAVPEDTVTVLIRKNKKNYAEGITLSIDTPSPFRVAPFCPDFGACGGCKWQMLPYDRQLQYKQEQVNDQLSRIGQVQLPDILPIVGSDYTQEYRNKLEFTFSTKRYLTRDEINEQKEGDPIAQEPALGFHAPGLFDKVVDIEHCYLQAEPTNKIKNFLRSYAMEHELPYYDYKEHRGFLRNVIIRVTTTGEVMVNLVATEYNEVLEALLDNLLAFAPEITSLNYTVNIKINDSIADLNVVHYSGRPYIEEKLEDFVFKISPKSFFQTNTRQAEKLYSIVRNFAGLTGNEIVYDLYCGTGSIGIFLSKGAKKIIGVEVIEEAIKDARINAERNQLKDYAFFTGDVSKVATDEFFAAHGRPDVIVTDPPRAGMDPKMVEQLLTMAAPRIVYVSCNPATQARDLALLDAKYKIERLQPVDMFPHTQHIENVALLLLK